MPVGHDRDGTACDCERCLAETATPPALPGTPRLAAADDQAWITIRNELQLTPGLCHVLEAGAPSKVTTSAIPGLHAIALSSPWHVLDAVAEPAGVPVDLPLHQHPNPRKEHA